MAKFIFAKMPVSLKKYSLIYYTKNDIINDNVRNFTNYHRLVNIATPAQINEYPIAKYN